MDSIQNNQRQTKQENEGNQDKSFFSYSPKSSSTTDFPAFLSNFQDEIIEDLYSNSKEFNCHYSRTKLDPNNKILHNCDQQSTISSCSQIPSYSATKFFESPSPFPNKWTKLLYNKNQQPNQSSQEKTKFMTSKEEINQQQFKFPGFAFANDLREYEDNISNDCEEAVRQQIISLDLEERYCQQNLQNSNKLQKLGVQKKKLNLNSSEFISFKQQDQQKSQSEIKIQKTQQQQEQQQQQIQLPYQTIDFSQIQDQCQLVPLSCSQLKDLYLSEQQNNTNSLIKNKQYYNQNQQQLSNLQMEYPSTPLTPQIPIANESQIIVQTTHNPFILEISAKRFHGFLKYFDPVKLYGFIVIDEENKEIFFHFQDVTHYLLTQELLTSFRDGRIIRLLFNICLYRGKTSVRRKAVNLSPLQ